MAEVLADCFGDNKPAHLGLRMAGILGLWRWLTRDKTQQAVALPGVPDQRIAIDVPEARHVQIELQDTKALTRVESRSNPGRYSYRNAMPALLPEYPYIWDRGLFTFQIVGELHYQEALEKIVGGRRDASVYCRVIAILSPEPENQYDPHAIVVRIDGEKVGYTLTH